MAATTITSTPSTKPINTLILDTGPILLNQPPVSTLIAQSDTLLTVPAIISEIRDAATRSRVATTLLPFLTTRQPRDASIAFVTDFARKTGDGAVLSRVDLLVAALAYEVEVERNGGDWRLRRNPGQRRVNGRPPVKEGNEAGAEAEGEAAVDEEAAVQDAESAGGDSTGRFEADDGAVSAERAVDEIAQEQDQGVASAQQTDGAEVEQREISEQQPPSTNNNEPIASITASMAQSTVQDESPAPVDSAVPTPQDSPDSEPEDSSDGGEWITPTNLSRKKLRDAALSNTTAATPSTLQCATLTTDHALQNLLLQINLNILSPANLTRITALRTTLLRCHACFLLHRQPDLQFCTRCGKPTLTRVSTTTTAATGDVRVHLKKNMQWNNRGERYSVPKPVAGTSNRKTLRGGGKGGWGAELVLAPDQKEYLRAEEERVREERRVAKHGDGFWDEDLLGLVGGGKRSVRGGGGAGARTKVGAGRNVNSRKR